MGTIGVGFNPYKPPNNRMLPNAYRRPVFQPPFASEQAVNWGESCWPGIG